MTESVPAVAPVTRIDLCCPYSSKDNCKTLGARFDNEKKIWYTNSDNPNISTLQELYTPIKCVCPFDDREQIKKLGATWDKFNKWWNVPSYRKKEINPDWVIT